MTLSRAQSPVPSTKPCPRHKALSLAPVACHIPPGACPILLVGPTGVLGSLQPYGPHISDHMILEAGLQPNRDVKVPRKTLAQQMPGFTAHVFPPTAVASVGPCSHKWE